MASPVLVSGVGAWCTCLTALESPLGLTEGARLALGVLLIYPKAPFVFKQQV